MEHRDWKIQGGSIYREYAKANLQINFEPFLLLFNRKSFHIAETLHHANRYKNTKNRNCLVNFNNLWTTNNCIPTVRLISVIMWHRFELCYNRAVFLLWEECTELRWQKHWCLSMRWILRFSIISQLQVRVKKKIINRIYLSKNETKKDGKHLFRGGTVRNHNVYTHWTNNPV